ncbi:MAG TPA: MMPL family transporter, partial [Gammaproteobacteria bacterium]
IIKNDLIVFGGLVAAMICLVLFLLFRKPRWIVITVLCCACSVLPTMGLFGIFDLETTVISSSFIALQLILTLAMVVHLIVQYREYSAAHPDWSQRELVRQTLLRKIKPTFYAGLTTGIGLASLLTTDLQPVISFGWMMVIALFVSIVVSLILFPALLVLLPREQPRKPIRFFHAIVNVVTSAVQKHGGITLLVGGLVFAAGSAGMFFLNVENSFINYFRPSTDVYKELSFIDRELGGTTPLDIIYTVSPEEEKEEADLVLSADTVQQLQRIQASLERYKAVGKVISVVNATELAVLANDGRPLTEYELTAVYWALEDALRTELLGSFLAPEHSQVRFNARIQDTTEGLDRAELLADIGRDMRELGIPGDRFVLTGLFVLYQDILQRLYRSQIQSLGAAYIVLVLTFLAVFRSIRIALVGVTPNIFATLLVLGVMGWLGIPLDIMTITIASVGIGMAVDDTIHYVQRYREELQNVPGSRAVENTNFSVGYAMIYTALIVILGFSLLAFSDFMPSVMFGLLTSLAMALALLASLSILPVLLIRFVKRNAGSAD